MEKHITRWLGVYQALLREKFRRNQAFAIEVLMMLVVGHLFGFYNPSQLADHLRISKNKLYKRIRSWSLYKWKRILLEVGCTRARDRIKAALEMSAATRSRCRITLSVDDTLLERVGEMLSYCHSWWSTKWKRALRGQNILAITVKVGEEVIPLSVRIVPKRGRGSTSKPELFEGMLLEVLNFFERHDIEITDFPITFDSWYGSAELVHLLEVAGFREIHVHAKGNYVFTIDGVRANLSEHKKQISLQGDQWGCDKPVARRWAESPTFGKVLLLLFQDRGVVRCVMVFGKALRSCEILRIWHQHHGIEELWRNLKSIVRLGAMRLRGQAGAYAGLGVKVLSYLFMVSIARQLGLTLHQLQVSTQREVDPTVFLVEHFHGCYG